MYRWEINVKYFVCDTGLHFIQWSMHSEHITGFVGVNQCFSFFKANTHSYSSKTIGEYAKKCQSSYYNEDRAAWSCNQFIRRFCKPSKKSAEIAPHDSLTFYCYFLLAVEYILFYLIIIDFCAMDFTESYKLITTSRQSISITTYFNHISI